MAAGKLARRSLDGCVRSAKASSSSGRVIACPLNLLYQIEVCNEPNENKVQQPSVSSREASTKQRKMRTAAKHGKEKIEQIL